MDAASPPAATKPIPLKSFSDLPVRAGEDLLGFARYSHPLVKFLGSEDLITALTIGIFGPWGSGKSSLLELIEEEMGSGSWSSRFVCVRFNPWVHRREPNMLVPLLHALHDELAKDESRFAELARPIFEVLSRLGLEAILKSLTVNTIDLKKLDELEKAYIESHRRVESEMRRLRTTLQEQAEEVLRRTVQVVSSSAVKASVVPEVGIRWLMMTNRDLELEQPPPPWSY
jgi:hypothetical protein